MVLHRFLRVVASLGLLGGVPALSGCPASEAPGVDAGADAAAFDAPATTDTGGDPVDAPAPADVSSGDDAPSPDGGPDSGGADAGVVDADGDGTPAAVDCDDADPAVGSSGARSCASACGLGVELCTGGVWGACDAPTDCSCTTPGSTRMVPCGMCGTAVQRCGTDMRWEMPSSCFSEGECFAGTIESDTSRCGLSERLCDASCDWLPWEVRTAPGECDPGTERRSTSSSCPFIGDVGVSTCSATCSWGPVDRCETTCTTSPATSRLGLESRCVPAGPSVLGNGSVPNTSPRITIDLSEFWIARYPVTAADYRACLAAGGCPTPADATYFDALADTTPAGGVTWPQARDFCVWDGGRLPTEYQWEKAARGPAPDARRLPWGDAVGSDCIEHTGPVCPWPFAVAEASLPGSVSPYGVRFLALREEWTNTPYRSGYGWITDLSDPPEPDPATYTTRTVRGTGWDAAGAPVNLPATSYRTGRTTTLYGAFRCVY